MWDEEEQSGLADKVRRTTSAAVAGLRRRLAPKPVEGPTVAIAFNLLPVAEAAGSSFRIGEQRLLLVQYWRQMQTDIAAKAARDAVPTATDVPVVDDAVLSDVASSAQEGPGTLGAREASESSQSSPTAAGRDLGWVSASVLFAKPPEPPADSRAYPPIEAFDDPEDAPLVLPASAPIDERVEAIIVPAEQLVSTEELVADATAPADEPVEMAGDGFELVAPTAADFAPVEEPAVEDEVARPLEHAELPFEAAAEDPAVEPLAAAAADAMVELFADAVDGPVIEPLVEAIEDPIIEPVTAVEDPAVKPEPAMVVALESASPVLETAVTELADSPVELADESQLEELIAQLATPAFPKPDVADVPIELATDEQIDRLIAQLGTMPAAESGPAVEADDELHALSEPHAAPELQPLPEPEVLPEVVTAAADDFAEHAEEAIEAARDAFVEPLVDELPVPETPIEVVEALQMVAEAGVTEAPEIVEADIEEPVASEPAVVALEVEMPAVVAETSFAAPVVTGEAAEPTAEVVREVVMPAMQTGHLAEPEVAEKVDDLEPGATEPAVAALEVEMPAMMGESPLADLVASDDEPEPTAEQVPDLPVPLMPSGHLVEPEVPRVLDEPDPIDDDVQQFEPAIGTSFPAAGDLHAFAEAASFTADEPELDSVEFEIESPVSHPTAAFAAPLTPEAAADDEPAPEVSVPRLASVEAYFAALAAPGFEADIPGDPIAEIETVAAESAMPALSSDPVWTDAVAEWTRTAQERPARRADVVPLVRPKSAVRLPKGHASLPALERFLRAAQARRRRLGAESVA